MKNLIRKIKGLEKISSRLNPGLREREAMLEQVRDYAETFLQQLPDKKTYIRDERINGFRDSPIQETAAELSDLLEFYHREVDTTGILPASGGQLGYIPGGGLYPSALGDYLADISNRYSGVAFAGPGAARMELALVEWMRRLVGYPDTAAGDLTSGGSIATLSALVTARDACGIEDSQIARSCIYLTAQAHHCISKALHVAGLKNIRQRIVGMDQRFRMDSEALQGMIDDDRARNLKPWAIVASAGTTDTGAVDPIREIAAIASKNKLWFHLDAAYGGFFLLCAEGREPLDGLDLADSVVMDPHKGLGIPYGTGAVLVREGHLLAESNRYYADYMQDAKRPGRDADGEFSPADYSLELTRPFRGPGMWFPLKLFGLEPFRASLAEKICLARYFHERIGRIPGFTAGPYPDLSIVTFRYVPQSGDANSFNRRLLEAVHADGRVFITSTMIDGDFTLRLAVLNFRTHLRTIDYLLDLLRREATELENQIL